MPEYMYFLCEWIVQPLQYEDIEKIVHISNQKDMYVFGGKTYKNTEGYWTMSFFIRTISQKTLDEFVKAVGSDIGWNTWVQVNQDNVAIGPTFVGSAMPDFLKGLNKMAQANSKLHSINS